MADEEVTQGLAANVDLLAKTVGIPKWARWFIGIVLTLVLGLGGCVWFVYLQVQGLKVDEKKDISETQTTIQTNQGKTNIELTKICHAVELLAEKTPNRDLVNIGRASTDPRILGNRANSGELHFGGDSGPRDRPRSGYDRQTLRGTNIGRRHGIGRECILWT